MTGTKRELRRIAWGLGLLLARELLYYLSFVFFWFYDYPFITSAPVAIVGIAMMFAGLRRLQSLDVRFLHASRAAAILGLRYAAGTVASIYYHVTYRHVVTSYTLSMYSPNYSGIALQMLLYYCLFEAVAQLAAEAGDDALRHRLCRAPWVFAVAALLIDILLAYLSQRSFSQVATLSATGYLVYLILDTAKKLPCDKQPC